MTPSIKSLFAAVATVAIAGTAVAQVQPPNQQTGTSAAVAPADKQNTQTPPPSNNATTTGNASGSATMNSGSANSSAMNSNSNTTMGSNSNADTNVSGTRMAQRPARADRN